MKIWRGTVFTRQFTRTDSASTRRKRGAYVVDVAALSTGYVAPATVNEARQATVDVTVADAAGCEYVWATVTFGHASPGFARIVRLKRSAAAPGVHVQETGVR